jgi:hypothetical protein
MKGASTIVTTTIDASRERVFYWFSSADPSRFEHRYGIMPGVVGIRNQTGPMHEPRSTREVLLSDGSTAFEEIESSDPPKSVRYRVSKLTSAFRYLVREGNAQISFRELPSGGTLVEWRYTFIGHNWLASLILQPLVRLFWRGFMNSALSRARRLAEVELHQNQS